MSYLICMWEWSRTYFFGIVGGQGIPPTVIKKSFHYFLLDTSCQIFGISCINFFLFNNLASLPIQKVLPNLNKNSLPEIIFLFYANIFCSTYTVNVLTIKTTGTGNCRGPAGKICTIYGKGL